MINIENLERLAKVATPGPWRGDRTDGTVKYDIVAGDYPNGEYTVVCHGDNGNARDGGYGFTSAENEAYALAANPAAVLELIAEVRRLREDLQATKLLAHANAEMFKAEKIDGDRYRWAISREDNAEELYGAVICNAPDVEAINAEIDGLMAKEKS